MSNTMNESTANSNGVYSLYSGWLKKPVIDDIPDDVSLEPELTELIDKSKEINTITEIDSFLDEIYKLRQESILNDGEYGKGNLIFKQLRDRGILQELKDKKVDLENKEMSIESLSEDSPTDYPKSLSNVLKQVKLDLTLKEMKVDNNLTEDTDWGFDMRVADELFNKYVGEDLSKSDVDYIWDEIMKEYDDIELAEEVCSRLEQYLDDLYLKPEHLEEEFDEIEAFNKKNESCIKEYRIWAGLGDDELITEENLNEWALNRVSCNENYDYNDLREVLLSYNR